MGIYGKHGRATSLSTSAPQTLLSAVAHPIEISGPSCPWSPMAGMAPISADVLCQSAIEAVRQRQYAWALVLLNQLIERHPERATYYSNRGLVNLWCGNHTAALGDFNQAIRLAAHLDQAYNNRATCYASLGLLEKALQDYDRAVELNPFNTRARINLGVTLRDLGNLDEALTCLDDALLFYQLAEHIYAERGRTYHLRGDWNCALADYRRCLEALASLEASHDRTQLAQRVQGWMDELLAGCQ